MRVWPHASQRSTCPPSVAVRQLSMADMTLSWPRLTWPALGDAPCRSVIAEDIRNLQHGTGQVPRGLRRRLHRRNALLKRAGDLAERLEGDAGVERGRIKL